MFLYTCWTVFKKESRVNHFWNLTPKEGQKALLSAWGIAPVAAKSFLSLSWKSIPNLPELVTGAAISSAVKIVAMGPLEKGFGDDPSLFTVIRNIVSIYAFHCHMQVDNEIGGTGVKYSNFHMTAAIATSAIKVVMIGSEVYFNGVSEGSLTKTATVANYVSEPPARIFWIMAQKQHDLKQEDVPMSEFIHQESKVMWLLEAVIGSTCRMYVASEWGKTVSGYLKLNEAVREIGNNLELMPINLIRENSILFNNTDDIYTKYAKIIETKESDLEVITYPIIFSTIAVIDFTTRLIPETVLGLIIVPPTRVTAAIVENHIGFITEDPNANNPTMIEYLVEGALLSTMVSGVVHAYSD